MTINKVQCDGCGKSQDRVISHYGNVFVSPEEWMSVKSKDLCPACTKKVEEFIQSLKK